MKVLIISADSAMGQQFFLKLEEAGHEVTSRPTSDFESSKKDSKLTGVEAILYLDPVGLSANEIESGFASYIESFKNCLDAAFKNKVQSFFLLSSAAEIYGDSIHWPVDERSALNPSTLYGSMRIAFEGILANMSSQKRFSGEISSPQDGSMSHYFTWASFRFSQIYGIPGGKDDLTSWVNSLKKGEVPGVSGDGSRQRDYLYINDAIAAVHVALLKSNESLLDSSFNISTGIGTTDLQVFQHILHQTKKWALQNPNQESKRVLSLSAPNYVPEEFGTLKKSVLNPARMEAMLGWRPQTSFEVGFNEVLTELLK